MQETKLKLLERIVDRRQDSLYRFAYIRTGSQADAEDIVQDVLLRLFHSDCNLDRIDDVERYLWRAIANRRCDYHRHRRNATLPTERAAALADDSGDRELREEYERIAGLLATLPEEQAEVIRPKTSDSRLSPGSPRSPAPPRRPSNPVSVTGSASSANSSTTKNHPP